LTALRLKSIGTIKLSDDADNIRYDSDNRSLYVGYGNGAIAVIDGASDRLLSNIKLASHPEAFELEKGSKRIYVNLPEDQEVAVADKEACSIKATWQIQNAKSNFPMALDNTDHRLFVGCRKPAKLLIFDTKSAKLVKGIIIDGDADDIFYSPEHRLVYISCGKGIVDVVQQMGPSDYNLLERITTASGARTSLLVPETKHFYLAVPANQHNTAEIQVFEIKP